jgi:pSer/pThr/pTyr-binding forkhead associated (FHA) protein
MLLQTKTSLTAGAGAAAGLGAWIFGDAAGLMPALGLGSANDPALFFARAAFLAVIGGSVGMAIGIVDGASRPSSRRWRTTTAGLGFGACGGVLGAILITVLQALIPDGADSGFAFALGLMSVAVGWGLMGAAAGAAAGIVHASWRVARHGAFGGLVGGLIGGFVTQIIAESLSDSPDTANALWLFTISGTGLLVGALSTLIADAAKQAYLVYGRANLLDEIILGPSATTIGTNAKCDVVLPQHAAFAGLHAVIEPIPQTRRHRLRHMARSVAGGASYASTYLNGEPLTSEKWLVDRDTIQLGDMRILFREKSTEKGVPSFAGPPTTGQPVQGIPQDMRTRMPTPADAEGLLTERDAAEVAAIESGTPRATVRPADHLLGTRLVGMSGPYQGQAFPMTHEEMLIGRSLDNAIALAADPSVSRTHARIIYEGGRHLISDAGSSHGVLVNNERATFGTVLRRGDVVTLGETRLRYE